MRTSPPPRSFALLPAAILVVATFGLAVPYYSLAPGPTENTKALIKVDAKTTPSPGKLLLTTVSLRSVNVAGAIAGWLDPSVDVLPRSQFVPKGTTQQEVDQANVDMMEDSKHAAAVAALRYLGYQVSITGAGARVESVPPNVPATQVLKPGDVIQAVDGHPLTDASELTTYVRRHKIGDDVAVRVLRAGKARDTFVRTVRSTQDPGAPIIGITIRTEAGHIDLPIKIDISSEGIGGPSAGLMFALGIVDLLQNGQVTQGLIVAGTGVISLQGQVGPVGGVVQKVAAAERDHASVFIAPREEEAAARAAAHKIKVVGVGTLSEAVQAIHDLRRPVQASGSSN